MHLRLDRLLAGFAALAALAAGARAQLTTLYAVDQASNLLRTIDPVTAATLTSLPMTASGVTIIGANGLARDPQSGDLWVLLKISGQAGRSVGRVDPCTGDVRIAGNTGISMASIAFTNNGTFLAASGDGATPAETLFVIDKEIGFASVIMALGNGNDGEAICVHPDDGRIYHASGLGTRVFETVDIGTTSTTNIPLSGTNAGEITALTAWSGTTLLASSINNELYTMSTGGVVQTIGSLGFTCKGLAFGHSDWALLTVSPRDGNLRTVSPADLSTIKSVPMITESNAAVTQCNGLSRHPGSGEIFVVFQTATPGRQLGHLNIDSGLVIAPLPLADKIADITFDATGTLYGVTGDGASTPSTLYTIDLSTGAMTLVTAFGNGLDGESICFNPNDGLIYHASGLGAQNVDEIFETYDPVANTITNVTLSGDDYGEVRAMLHFVGDSFFIANYESQRVHLLSTTGVVQRLGTVDHDVKGIAYTSSTPFCLRTTSPFDGNLETVSRVDLATVATTPLVDSAAATIGGSNGMDRDPTTGQPYLLVKVGSSRYLGTIDYQTGTVTRIGTALDNFAGLAFTRQGQLYGVTGDGASVPSTLYAIDKATAATTLNTTLGNGNDGESIAHGWGTGQMYHCSGYGVPNDPVSGEVFESVNTGTSAVSSITLSGYDYDEIFSMTPTLRNGFLCSDLSHDIVFINTRGVASDIGDLSRYVRGITFDPPARIGYNQLFGAGCAATGGSNLTPIMSISGLPNLGNTVRVWTSNGPASAPMFLLFGFGPTSTPLGPFGYTGCNIQMSTQIVSLFYLLDASGQSYLDLPVPLGYAPANFLFQSAVLDGPRFSVSNPVRMSMR